MPASSTQPRSIRWKMLVTVNAVLTTALMMYLAFDYREDWNKRLADKRSAMIEEARLLAPAVVRLSQMHNQGGPFELGRRFSPSAALRPKDAPLDENADVTGTTQPSDANLSPAERQSLAVVGRAVAPPPRPLTNDVISSFLRSLCERKLVTSDVNYQLAVRIGDSWYQERKVDSRHLVPTGKLAEGIANPSGITLDDGDVVVVVSDTLDDGAVYVVESLSKMMRQARVALAWHVLAIGCIGLGVTAIVDLILLRLVSRPLGALVATVRKIKAGELGIKAPPGSSREVESLVGEVNQLSQSLALAQVHRVRQMDKARRVQERLFPAGSTVGPVKVQSVHTAASIVGGDYFDHKEMPDGSILVMLVDVSGHGVPAAMGAAMLKALFDANTRSPIGLVELVIAINQGFCEVSLDEDFATIIIVRIEPAMQRLQFVNAGHETAYVIPRGGSEPLREMKSTGPLVGVMRDAEWTVGELAFEPGDKAVLLTDGVIECRSLAGDMLGRKRICSMLLRARDTPFDSFTPQVIGDIETFRAGIAPNDDLTLLTLEY